MKYFCAKINDDLHKEIHLDAPLVVHATEGDVAEKVYRTLENTDSAVISYPIVDGVATLVFQTDNFKIGYTEEQRKLVSVFDKRRNVNYVGVLVNTIPAGIKPTEEEILEFFYRGNVAKYNADLETAKSNDAVKYNLRRIRKSAPWDRWVVDVGYHQVIIPITENYEVSQ